MPIVAQNGTLDQKKSEPQGGDSEEDGDGGWADFSGPALTSERTSEPTPIDQMQEQTQGAVAFKPINLLDMAAGLPVQPVASTLQKDDPFRELFSARNHA